METAVTSAVGAAPAPVFTGWIERAQPHLGTLVRIGVRGLPAATALAAMERAFAAVAQIHALMSFHEPDSELSRLNREASIRSVRVDRRTREVLELAVVVAAASSGVFDVSVAPQLVDWGFLPEPAGAPRPDPQACWRDVTIAGDDVRFERSLWLDLGGIAKGYAVDTALAAMALPRGVQAYVDAGGDLRVAGPDRQRVVLRAPGQAPDALPVVELTDGAIASSTGAALRRPWRSGWAGPHVHGGRDRPAPIERFVSVVAPRCAVADALTKVALAAGTDAAAALAQFGATAHLFSRDTGWQTIGTPT